MNDALNDDYCAVEKSRVILKQLEKLGYNYPFTSGSFIPLLEKLVRDVLTLKEEVEQYKNLIKKVGKEKNNLEKGLIPYQQDNGRLAIENTDLHQKLFQWEQKYERLQKEVKKKERQHELKVADLEFLSRVYSQRVKNLEQNNHKLSLAYKNLIIKCQDVKGKANPIMFEDFEPLIEQEVTKHNLWTENDETNKESVISKGEKMNKEVAELLEEVEDLKLDNQHQSEIIVALKCQVAQKEREICRLRHMLEGGRSLSAVTRDCCQQCIEKDCRLKSLEEQLREAVDKQHEAMSRALHLAEKNQHLERELKDIDNVALAVEKECQNKVKNNLKNMDVVEEKLRRKNIEIKKLEETVANMRNKIERDELELENLRKEKQMLEKNLHAATGEKKHLNDKINYFLLIEKNLNAEIARMQEINKSLQRQICDMENRVMDILGTGCRGQGKDKQKKQSLMSELSGSKSQIGRLGSQTGLLKTGKDCRKHSNDDCFHRNSSAALLDKIQQERDFYHNECHRLKDHLLSFRTESSSDLMRQIKDLEKEMVDLRKENLALRRENSSILKRMECTEHATSCSSGDSLKIILDRLEKERDLALSDISRLQGERDALKERLKLAAETHMGEQSRFDKIIMENEERIRRLEAERRELITGQSSQRISLAGMEEKCDEYRENMRKAHSELAQMKANYCQLKSLQEKTDRSMMELQSRYDQTELELRIATGKIQELERTNGNSEKEIADLRKEKTELMSSVTFIEKEKDGLLITLDEKTEKVAKLESHMKKQEEYVSELMDKISHLEKKLEFTLTEKTNRDYGFRSLERQVESLREELQNCQLQKEALVRENGRLQDDLASAAKDCLTARRELDAEKQDVENLKKQLQQYVTEVKKAEELLTKKEAERNQMLDHFRSLSIEATTLETNNHTLESTVENAKTELMTYKNKISDLEHEIASKETLLYNYEKQIADLTTQIAELESKLKMQTDMRMRAEDDLKALRSICSTLDGQKEALKRAANDQDAEKIHLINEVRRLSQEYEGLNQKLTHERTLSQTLEKSLSNSRQETLEHKITNKDLQMHVQHLRQKVDELTQKLESESQDVRRYQAQCADLSQQVSELRREVTNARFEHARTKEDSRRSLTQCSHSDEDSKEICYEGLCLENSSRNIPPLCFPDDSDRTVSLDSDTDNIKLLLAEDPDNYLRKPYWKLSPVAEKREEHSETNTSSLLSSLPEDNGKSASFPEDDKTEASAYPTYSVRGRCLDDVPGVSDRFRDEEIAQKPETFYPTVGSSYGILQPTIDCNLPKSNWIESFSPVGENHGEENLLLGGRLEETCSRTPSVLEKSRKIPDEFESRKVWENVQVEAESFSRDETTSEIDENTFSLNGS